MIGPQHWREADQLLTSDPCEYGCPHSGCAHEMTLIARAQVHAMLAAAAVSAAAQLGKLPADDAADWQAVLSLPEDGS